MGKIKISLEDPDMREIWNAALDAKDEVASWPAWKHGEQSTEHNEPTLLERHEIDVLKDKLPPFGFGSRCPKCKRGSGDDWQQCDGECPVPCSPHYSESCECGYARLSTLGEFKPTCMTDEQRIAAWLERSGAPGLAARLLAGEWKAVK